MEHIVQVVQVGDQVLPESHLGGPVVVTYPWLQPDVQVQLVTGVVLGPGHLLKPIGLGVDELGVLGDGLVGVPVKNRQNRASTGKSQRGEKGEPDAEMEAGGTFASGGMAGQHHNPGSSLTRDNHGQSTSPSLCLAGSCPGGWPCSQLFTVWLMPWLQ